MMLMSGGSGGDIVDKDGDDHGDVAVCLCDADAKQMPQHMLTTTTITAATTTSHVESR